MSKKILMPIITPRKRDEVDYRKAILELLRPTFQKVRNELLPIYSTLESNLVKDSSVSDITNFFKSAKALSLDDVIESLVNSKFLNNTLNTFEKKNNEAFKKKLGIDVFSNRADFADLLKIKAAENANLISDLSDDYISRIATATYESVANGERSSELLKKIRKIEGLEVRRAKFIARDQVSNLTADLNEVRQKSLGVDKYRWRTMGDERVRGNPAGLYPKARPSHFARNNKIFSWDDAPKGGHPGKDYNCRCIAQAIIEI